MSESLNNRAGELKHPRARIAALEAVQGRCGRLMAKVIDTRHVLQDKQDAPLPNGIRPGERIMRVERLLNEVADLAEFELDQIMAEVEPIGDPAIVSGR